MPEDAATIERPLVRTPEEMGRISEELERRGYEADRLDEILRTIEDREEFANHLRDIDPTLNGNVDHLIDDLGLYHQELETKRNWSLWESIKKVPGKIWGTVKRHPVLTTAVIVSVIAAALYATGAGTIALNQVRGWIAAELAKAGIGGAAEGVAEAGAEAAAEAVEAAEGALRNIPSPSDLPLGPFAPEPPLPPLPTEIPSIEDALKILESQR